MRKIMLSLVGLVLAARPIALFADHVVPGFMVEVYASVTDPVMLSAGPTGSLFVGRDNSGSGGTFGDPVKIHRVALGGLPVMEYGSSAVADPDAVVIDAGGVFGTPGAVLVGGSVSLALGGHIKSILPDQSVVPLFGPTTTFHNPTDLVIDHTGRLLFTNYEDTPTSPAGVFATSSASVMPSPLFTTSVNIVGIAVDPSDQIFVSMADGRIEKHASDGSLLDSNFVTGLGMAAPLAVGPLVGSSHDLYAINSAGELLRVTMSGASTVIGSGFVSPRDLVFGPDEALYVSEFQHDRLVRVVPPTALCDFDGNRACDIEDLNALLFEGPIVPGVTVTPGSNDQFDVNHDGVIDNADVDRWLAAAAVDQGLSSPYRRGDANLDGVVDGSDFGNWNSHKFQMTLQWDHGNFNGDAVVDGSDFGIWNAAKFTSSAAGVGVPEPSGLVVLILTAIALTRRSCQPMPPK